MSSLWCSRFFFFFFFNDTATTEIYTLSLHNALPISYAVAKIAGIKLCESYNRQHGTDFRSVMPTNLYGPDRKSTRLNSSHSSISYAVFCLKKKKKNN